MDRECYFCDQVSIDTCGYCQVSFCHVCLAAHDQTKCREIHDRIQSHAIPIFSPSSVDFLPILAVPVSPVAMEDIACFRRKVYSAMQIPEEYLNCSPSSFMEEDRRLMEAVKEELKRQWR